MSVIRPDHKAGSQKGRDKMKVRNMTNSNGNKVANQFIITDQNTTYFQSYETVIAKVVCRLDANSDEDYTSVYLDCDTWDYSKTTSQYRNIFLGETKKETEAKIKSGEYTLANLN